MLKASHGGGGRGIRVVATPEEMPRAFETAAREAVQAFGNGELYVEKLLEEPRHIEVQIVGDGKGGVVHFFERDCSMQRRNQKLIEESPAPNLDPDLRQRLWADAVRAAKAGNYRSAGTVEFLVAEGKHYFLEVNARLQVEHPVTEMVTVIDLVKLQLELAAGEEALPAQDDVYLHGHAVECRVNAEDPRRGFLPSPGRIGLWQPPCGPGVRVDGAGYPGGQVSPHFDSLLAKLIVHGRSRAEAIARMRHALEEFVVTGVRTTLPFHRFAMGSSAFAHGRYSTATVGAMGPAPPPPPDEIRAAALAAILARALEGPPQAARQSTSPRRGPPPAAMRAPFGPSGAGWFHEL
jgi:acetyl-CoA carboxylase biotin carboxylase subunit